MRTARVRIRAGDWRSHNRNDGHPRRKFKPEWVTVLLPPEAPDHNWKCDTRHVWRIAPVTLRELDLPDYLPYYACHHQIEVD